MSRTFRSLAVPHYRWYAAASLLTNVAMWMQRIDQDWLAVKLSGDGMAVGIVTALQFLPTLLLGPFAGSLADRVRKRPLLVATCVGMGLPALVLGGFLAAGEVTVWHIYACALVLGIASAVDGPARMAYIREILAREHLTNAIGLNQVNFHTSRIIGPALAGFLISATGLAPAFFAVGGFYWIAAAMLFRVRETPPATDADAGPPVPAGLGAAIRQLADQPGLIVVTALAAAVSAFSLNFQITLTLMATLVFDLHAAGFGGMTSMMAVGSITGALMMARLERPSYARVLVCAALLGVAYLIAARAPSAVLFAVVLTPIGLLSNSFMSTASAVVQLRVGARLQGRITGLYMAATNALAPLGAVLIGWAASVWSPREALSVAGAISLVGAGVGLAALLGLRAVAWKDRRLADAEPIELGA